MSGPSAPAFVVAPVTLESPDGAACLEPLSLAHAPGLLEAGRDPAVWRYMPAPTPRSLDEARAIILQALDAQVNGQQVPFAIVEPAGGRPIGSTRYLNIEPENRSLEIGWTWIGVPWQRTGVNTRCKYLLLRHAFEALDAVRVQLRTDGRNSRSQAAIARLGAVREGVLRRSRVMHDGFIRDTVFYSVLAEEWPAVRSRLEGMMAPR